MIQSKFRSGDRVKSNRLLSNRIEGHAAPIFIVGSGRSGTTLMQAYIGAHTDVLTFPETNYVGHAVGDHMTRVFCQKKNRWSWRTHARSARIALGYSTRALRRLMDLTLSALEQLDRENPIPSLPIKTRSAIRLWARTLDQICEDLGKRCWLEKTPMHVGYIEEILDALPDARFVHLLRDPEAVVASMIDASQKYPAWTGYSDVAHCLEIWNKCVGFTSKYAGSQGHFVIRYEDFVADPEGGLNAVFRFCHLSTVPFNRIEAARRGIAEAVSSPSEPWKKKVGGTLQNLNKASSLLSDADREYISGNAVSLPPSSWSPGDEQRGSSAHS